MLSTHRQKQLCYLGRTLLFLFPPLISATSSPGYTMSQVTSTLAPILAPAPIPTPTRTPTTSSNFQPIFNAAIKSYEKKTKKDLLAHPLSAQLQACNSPGDILAVLQSKVNELDQLRSANSRLSQWLNPTINVLHSFSATLGLGVGLVSTVYPSDSPPQPTSQVFSPSVVIFSGIGVLLSVGSLFIPCLEAILTTNSVTGGQRRRSQSRRPHRSL